MQRKVYRLKAGKISNLTLVTDHLDPPAATEVQVEVYAFGLNFADLFAIWGLYDATPKGEFTPGLEYSGTIVACGAEVQGFANGDRIMGITKFGGYASLLNIDHRYVVPIPADWNFSEGASFLVQVLTAYYAVVNLGNLQPQQSVLIHSGAGGVGIYANRLAKLLGAHTIGTTGSESKLEFMLAEDYDQVLVRTPDFKSDLLRLLDGRPLNVILECIGGRVLKDGFDLLAPEGRMVVYGSAHFASSGDSPHYFKLLWNYLRRPKIDPLTLPKTNRSLMGFNLIWLYEEVHKMHTILQALQNYDLGKPHIGHTFKMQDLLAALSLFQSGETVGKVVMTTE
ncbi:MAG: zinc-binding dehydrogenase [Saprospiraceae bacterium]|nr:zinc-binding dehydrogenase [Saprospiraceae bacterium]